MKMKTHGIAVCPGWSEGGPHQLQSQLPSVLASMLPFVTFSRLLFQLASSEWKVEMPPESAGLPIIFGTSSPPMTQLSWR